MSKDNSKLNVSYIQKNVSNTLDIATMRKLELHGKGIDEVEDLSQCKCLERLDISKNNISKISSMHGMKLKWLSVAKNQLKNLEMIFNCQSLHVLNASHNQLKAIKDTSELTQLKALILNNNEITSFGEVDCPELNTLVLSQNKIKSFNSSSFENLTKLSLSNNHMTSIPIIKKNKKLKELRLSHNKISVLDNQISRCKKLMVIDLGNNEIATFESLQPLQKIPYLLNLNLKDNPICQLPSYESRVRQLLPSLKVLDGKKICKDGEKPGPKRSNNPFDVKAAESKTEKIVAKDIIVEKKKVKVSINERGFRAKNILPPEAIKAMIKLEKSKLNKRKFKDPVKEIGESEQSVKIKKKKTKSSHRDKDTTLEKKKSEQIASTEKMDTEKLPTDLEKAVMTDNNVTSLTEKRLGEKKKKKTIKKDHDKRTGVISVKKVRQKDVRTRESFDISKLEENCLIGEGTKLISGWT